MKHSILPSGFLFLVAAIAQAAPNTSGNDPASLQTVSRTVGLATWLCRSRADGVSAINALYTVEVAGLVDPTEVGVEMIMAAHYDSTGGSGYP
jgi:hypothetical protein